MCWFYIEEKLQIVTKTTYPAFKLEDVFPLELARLSPSLLINRHFLNPFLYSPTVYTRT
jgi:hypothetical protein